MTRIFSRLSLLVCLILITVPVMPLETRDVPHKWLRGGLIVLAGVSSGTVCWIGAQYLRSSFFDGLYAIASSWDPLVADRTSKRIMQRMGVLLADGELVAGLSRRPAQIQTLICATEGIAGVLCLIIAYKLMLYGFENVKICAGK